MQILILVILIGLNAFFAASEIAFISLNDAKIDRQAKDGNRKARKIKKMLKEPSKFLATIQIGKNGASLTREEMLIAVSDFLNLEKDKSKPKELV